jgi:hypothetical protein
MRTATATVILLLSSLGGPAIAQVPSHFHPINLLDAVVMRPPEQQDLVERDIARQLAASRVPTVVRGGAENGRYANRETALMLPIVRAEP